MAVSHNPILRSRCGREGPAGGGREGRLRDCWVEGWGARGGLLILWAGTLDPKPRDTTDLCSVLQNAWSLNIPVARTRVNVPSIKGCKEGPLEGTLNLLPLYILLSILSIHPTLWGSYIPK